MVCIPESWHVKPSAAHSCGHCSAGADCLSWWGRSKDITRRLWNQQIRSGSWCCMLVCAQADRSWNPSVSIPTSGSHGEVQHSASVHRSHRALYRLKPYKLYYPKWEYVESHEFCISTLWAEDDTCFSEKTHPFSGTVFFCYCASAHSPTPLLHSVCGSIAVYSAFLM